MYRFLKADFVFNPVPYALINMIKVWGQCVTNVLGRCVVSLFKELFFPFEQKFKPLNIIFIIILCILQVTFNNITDITQKLVDSV